MTDRHSTQRAVLARDAALRRLRRLTGALIAGAVALSGVFAGVAASSTHHEEGGRSPAPARHSIRRDDTAVAARAVGPCVRGALTVRRTRTSGQAPAPTPEPPVVVSGGS